MNNHYKQKPVIFLAFANAPINKKNYLRNLSNENRAIRNALEKAQDEELCELVERANATIKDIMNVFQDKKYRDRIAIFHYGGHANAYGILLESSDGSSSPANKEGLAFFLARQNSLKLVFLNACSTQHHALELRKAGIPVVIGTSQDIKDQVATQLATRFYMGIGSGHTLERAWREAKAEIKIEKDSPNFNTLYHWSQRETHQYRYPWDIYFKEGAEKVKEWNLPDAAKNPLFGLPSPPRTYKLPEKPFLFLKRYQRKHAEIFFGRSYYIRQLYDRITDKESPPIILLFGQSGVGKSSLLEAGLLPRLEESHGIIYTRRLQEKGLLGTLEDTLDNQLLSLKADIQNEKIGEKWKHIEFVINKPLVIIIDQVEEMFIHPDKKLSNELENFTAALETLFNSPAFYPEGKLILSYRKEYHPDIEEQLKVKEFDRAELFIKPLTRQDIIEVVTGLTSSKRLQDRYKLQVEEQLPRVIADDMLEDRESPVAPVLQILLTKMWEKATQGDFSSIHKFRTRLYQALKREGFLMEDFFTQQMEKLKDGNPDVVESGLALDMLKFHTTSLGTACSHNIESLRERYRHSQDIIDDLIDQLKLLYLLTDTQQSKKRTCLAHDTLAPIIIKEYNNSDKPGQRAIRILASRIEDFKKNPDEIWLNEAALRIVEEGRQGIRILDKSEENLLEKSIERRIQSQKQINRFRMVRSVLVIFTIIFAIFAAWQWKVASDRARIAKAIALTYQAQLKFESPDEALELVRKAYHLDKNKNVMQVLSQAAAETLEHPLCNLNLQHTYYVNTAVFSPSGLTMLTASEDKTAKLWDLQGKLLQDLKHKKAVTSAAFSADGLLILTVPRDKAAKIWDLQGNFLQHFKHQERINSAVFSPDGRTILTASNDNTARLWNVQGAPINTFYHRSDVNAAMFSPGGSRILTLCKDKTASLLDLNGIPIIGFPRVNSAEFSPNGKFLIFILMNNAIKLRNLEDNSEKLFKNLSGYVTFASFSPNSRNLVLAYLGGAFEVRDLNGQLLTSLDFHKDTVFSVEHSLDNTKILTASRDKTAKLWILNGSMTADLHLHRDHVISAVFSPDSTRILTASLDMTAKMWDLRDQLVTELISQKDEMKCANFSPDGTRILTISKSNIVQLWNMRGNCMAALNTKNKHKKTVHQAVFSPDGTRILTASADNTAKLWDLEGSLIKDFNLHTANVESAVFSPDGRFILTASYDKTARLWDLQGNPPQSYRHQKAVISARFSPDGKKILTSSFDETARLWDLQGNELKMFKRQYGQVKVAKFSPDGKKVLTVSASARLWHINGKHLAEFNILKYIKGKMRIEENHFVSDADFSPNSKCVLTIHNDNTARLWNLKGKLLTQMKHKAKINTAYFSPDSKRILTASADNTIKLWDLQGNLLSDMVKHKGEVFSAVFSPDGYKILSTSADKTVKLWYTPRGIIRKLEKHSYPLPILEENSSGE